MTSERGKRLEHDIARAEYLGERAGDVLAEKVIYRDELLARDFERMQRAAEVNAEVVRDFLVALCERDGISTQSEYEPDTPAPNWELADRLRIGHVFGITPACPRCGSTEGNDACPECHPRKEGAFPRQLDTRERLAADLMEALGNASPNGRRVTRIMADALADKIIYRDDVSAFAAAVYGYTGPESSALQLAEHIARRLADGR